MCIHVAHLWLCCCTALEYISTKTLGCTFPALSALTNLLAVYMQKHFYNLKKEIYFALHHVVKFVYFCLMTFNLPKLFTETVLLQSSVVSITSVMDGANCMIQCNT